jgi:hypothetical protein
LSSSSGSGSDQQWQTRQVRGLLLVCTHCNTLRLRLPR